MNKLYIELEQEQINYLQRLGIEVDSMAFIIDRLFENHKNDTDNSMFDSIPWNTYLKKFEQTNCEYNFAKSAMSDILKNIIANKLEIEDPETLKFDWSIDFYKKIAEITLK